MIGLLAVTVLAAGSGRPVGDQHRPGDPDSRRGPAPIALQRPSSNHTGHGEGLGLGLFIVQTHVRT